MTTIVGIQEGKIIRSSTRFERTRVGLERIFEVYSCRTQDLADIIETIKLGATHKDVYSLVQGGQSLDQYDEMLVEQVSYDNGEGGITTISVNYVGLFQDKNPTPLISIQPLDSNNYLHIPYQYTIIFVTKVGKPASQEEISFINRFLGGQVKVVNGTALPVSPITPYRLTVDLAREKIKAPYKFSLDWTAGQPATYDETEFLEDGGQITRTYSRTLAYSGFVQTGFSYERYGLFAEVIITMSDGAVLEAGTAGQTTVTLPSD